MDVDDEEEEEQTTHEGVSCDGCGKENFTGSRYRCLTCEDYDLCEECYTNQVENKRHSKDHKMQSILAPNTGAVGAVVTLTAQNQAQFDSLLLSTESKICVVNFYASWYKPCEHFYPTFSHLSLEYPGLLFIKLDIDECKDIAKKYNAISPLYYLFTHGQASVRVEGVSILSNMVELERLLRYEIEKLGGKPTQVVESTNKAKKKRVAVDNTLIDSNNNNAPVVAPVVTPVTPAPSPYKHFPTQMFVLFDTINLPPVIKKIKEVNADLASKSDPSALTDAELKLFDHVIEVLTQTSKYHVTSFTKQEFQVVQKLLSWPIKQRFPCMDFFRTLVTHPHATQYYQADDQRPFILSLLNNISDAESPVPNQFMTLRFVANLFQFLPGRRIARAIFSDLLQQCLAVNLDDARTQLGLTTVLLDYATLFISHSEPGEDNQSNVDKLATMTLELLNTTLSEDSLYRVLVTLGALGYTYESVKKVLLDKLDYQLNKQVDAVKNTAKNQETVEELRTMLHAN
eukprot:TRINITY_DN3410_c0_g1_i1.p1 TRINITY_DN3410_c0_g1~~TRINITY_DN3410_c0_g1_i1.p1  ORF type:complete len:547 (-),score=174.66 TRINITY_DN3410_c0_g1_i1:44-1585(-)